MRTTHRGSRKCELCSAPAVSRPHLQLSQHPPRTQRTRCLRCAWTRPRTTSPSPVATSAWGRRQWRAGGRCSRCPGRERKQRRTTAAAARRRGRTKMTPLTTGCHLGVLTQRESKEALTICTTVQGARCVCEEASATSATSQHRRRGTLPLSTRSQPYDVDHPIVQDPSCPSLGTGQPAEVAPLADKRGELGAAWTALYIYHARRSDHSRQVLCRPLRSISTSG